MPRKIRDDDNDPVTQKQCRNRWNWGRILIGPAAMALGYVIWFFYAADQKQQGDIGTLQTQSASIQATVSAQRDAEKQQFEYLARGIDEVRSFQLGGREAVRALNNERRR